MADLSPGDERIPPGGSRPDDAGMTAAPAPAPPEARTTARTTYRSVFADREFRVLFSGLLMFVLGFEFEILGLSVLVYAQTRSAFLSALAFSMGFAPQAVGGGLFASLADRLPPRAVISLSLLIRSIPGLVIGLRPGLPVPVMLVLVAGAAMVAPVFLGSNSGLLAHVLAGDRYVLGRSVFSITGSSIQVIGLGIGGVVLAALPPRWLLVAAGASLALAGLVARLGLRPRPATAGETRIRGAIRATLAGNIELAAIRRVRDLLLAQWLPVWFVTGAESLIVPYTGSIGRPASAASPLLAAVPAGMLLGDLIIGRFCGPAMRQRLAFPLAVLMGAPLVVLIFRPSLTIAGAAFLLSGFGYAYQLGIQQEFLASLPERLRGQAFGLNATGQLGGEGLIPPAAGALAAALGAGAAIAAAGVLTILAAAALRGPLTGRRAVTAGPAPRPGGDFPSREPHDGEPHDRDCESGRDHIAGGTHRPDRHARAAHRRE
jgi:hypothetical protein